MKRLLIALCALLIASPAYAGTMSLLGAGKPPTGGGGGGYTGPGDVVGSAKAWYGLRAYSAAVAATGTQKAVNVTRASDSHTCDILIATSGDLGSTSGACVDGVVAAATWCNATTCSINTLYDQSGSGFDAGASGTAPTLVFSCLGSKACMQFGGAGGFGAFSATSTLQTLTVSAVAIRTGGTGQQDILSDATGIFFQGSFGSGQASGYFGAVAAVSASDSNWHAMQWVVSGNTSAINVDGTDTSTGLDFSTAALSSGYYIGRQNTGSYLTGKIAEVGMWGPSLGFTLSQRGNMCHNQFAYWGTSTSC